MNTLPLFTDAVGRVSELTIYTIGYGGRKPSDFFERLPAHAVVLDVRDNPYGSFRMEFDYPFLKKQLSHNYQHVKAWGNPSRDISPWKATQAAKESMAYWSQFMRDLRANVVLMCAERSYKECHRQYVAQELAILVPGVRILHL